MDKHTFSYLASVEIFVLSPARTEVLLLERALTKTVLPGFWAGLGGKMDAKILESPRAAAVREMTEESGYTLRNVTGFRPAGLYTVEDRFGRWLIFEFTCVAKKKLFRGPLATEEGTLSWVPLGDLPGIKLIPDLRQGLLETMLDRNDFLEVTVSYDRKGKMRRLVSYPDMKGGRRIASTRNRG
jgi:8-oxo-dGTP pyrophosphatase MutT (NUDIX family)